MSPGTNYRDIDPQFMAPFLRAAIRVFQVQCSLELKAGKPYMKEGGGGRLMGKISGLIPIDSKSFSGSLAISMEDSVFFALVKSLFGEEVSAVSAENADLAAELANMILGQAKVELGNLGKPVGMALPVAVWGTEHDARDLGQGKCVVIPFESSAGKIFVEIVAGGAASESVA